MTSGAYLQASHRSGATAEAETASADTIDQDNALRWQMPLRRLEAEAVRDAILAASGALDQTAGSARQPPNEQGDDEPI